MTRTTRTTRKDNNDNNDNGDYEDDGDGGGDGDGDAYLERALLIRERTDMLKEVVGVDLRAIKSSPGSVNDLILRNEDELVVPSAFDFEENRTVEINGEILNPGKFPFIRKMKLYDLIIQAGGMKESAAEIVEISRVTNTDSTGLVSLLS